MSKPLAIICDLDGTLCNIEHRLHYLRKEPPDWKSFFERISQDTLNESLADFLRIFLGYREVRRDVNLIFVSGRPENYRESTLAWLDQNLSRNFDYFLFMRKSEDRRADFVVKEEILKEKILPSYDVLCVIDDRPSVVEMWRRNGLLCFAMPHHEGEGESKNMFKDNEVSLVLLVGPSGAGKTSWMSANIHGNERSNFLSANYGVHPTKQAFISSDLVRYQMTQCWDDLSKQPQVFEYIHDFIRMNVKAGFTTIVDATNIKNKYRKEMVELVPKSTRVLYIVIDRDLEEKLECYTLGKDYTFHTNEEVIKKHDQVFRSNIKEILSGDGYPNVEVIDKRHYKEGN